MPSILWKVIQFGSLTFSFSSCIYSFSIKPGEWLKSSLQSYDFRQSWAKIVTLVGEGLVGCRYKVCSKKVEKRLLLSETAPLMGAPLFYRSD